MHILERISWPICYHICDFNTGKILYSYKIFESDHPTSCPFPINCMWLLFAKKWQMWLCRNREPQTMVSTSSTTTGSSRQHDPPPLPFDGQFYNPTPRHCQCVDKKPAVQFVSWTRANPMRRFTVCPLRFSNPVGSFGWLLHSFGWLFFWPVLTQCWSFFAEWQVRALSVEWPWLFRISEENNAEVEGEDY